VSAPPRSLREGDLVEVLRSGERRRISEIHEGTPTLYRACVLQEIPEHVRGHRMSYPLREPCEWYLAQELRLQ
jgi:hypothetical protein